MPAEMLPPEPPRKPREEELMRASFPDVATLVKRAVGALAEAIRTDVRQRVGKVVRVASSWTIVGRVAGVCRGEIVVRICVRSCGVTIVRSGRACRGIAVEAALCHSSSLKIPYAASILLPFDGMAVPPSGV